MTQRPTSITVLAIIGCIFAVFGVLCGTINSFSYLTMTGEETEIFRAFGLPEPQISPTARAMLFVNAAISVLVSVILGAGSIGSFMMRSWARKTMNAYATINMLNMLFNLLVTLVFIMPTMMSQMPQFSQPGGQAGALIGSVIGAVISFLCSAIYPICVLYFYNTEYNRDLFSRNGEPRPGYVAAPPPPGHFGYPGMAPQGGYQQPGGYQGYPPAQQPPQAPPSQYPPQYPQQYGQPNPLQPPPQRPPSSSRNVPPMDPGPLPPPGQAPPGNYPPPPPPDPPR